MCISARAVLTSIKYTITLYIYINMRNRSILGGREGSMGKEVSVYREKGLEKLGLVSWT